MGRPRIKIIDDAQLTAEVKNQKVRKSEFSKEKPKVKTSDKAKRAKIDEASRLFETDEVRSESTSPDVHEPDRVVSEQSEEVELEKQAQPSERSSKPQKPGKAKPRSKRYQEISKDLDRSKIYSLSEAVDMVKKLSYSKFPGTLETHINTAQTGIRGLVSLPYVTGKKLRILAFGPKVPEEATAGDDSTIDTFSKGKIDFDLVITTPEWMPKLAKVAKILGPRGLMPNPKNGTITEDLKKAVEGFQADKTEYKTEPKAAIIHLALGKLNQPNEELIANIKTLYQTIGKSKVKKITLSPTMGPSVKIDLSSL